MHRLLNRLLKLTYGKDFDLTTFDDKTLELFKRIEESYIEIDKNKHSLEHTLQINSEELTQAYKTIEQNNKSLKDEVNEKEIILQQYKDAMDTALIVSKMDINNRTTYVNNQFCELTQYIQQELLGQEHILLHARHMKQSDYSDMREKLIKNDIWEGRIESKNKSGGVYHVDVSVFPLVNTKGEVLEYMILEHDITKLEYARELAEASIQAKSQFMAHMSHEIRTPMNGIIGFTELLMKGNLDEKQKEYIRLTENSMQTLLKITNDILDFSKIESGHLNLDFIEVNPFVDLKNALVMASSKCREKHISFQMNIDTNISECIIIDKLRVTQILNNLISNAIKFTPEQGLISLDISKIFTEGNKERLLFSVTDTGIGISKKRVDDIFNSFIQADNSITRKFGGTGLGLSISKSLCELMKSELKVDSEENKGSRFYFELDVELCQPKNTLARQIKNPPIYIIDESSVVCDNIIEQLNNFAVHFERITLDSYLLLPDKDHIIIIFEHTLYQKIISYSKTIILIDDSKEALKLNLEDDSVYHIDQFDVCPSILYNAILKFSFTSCDSFLGKRQRHKKLSLSVLVAEDYEINRILINEMLDIYGIKADFAVNGAEAVKQASKITYDLIFMDINMPELNGIEAAKMIHDKSPDIPIVALTANALEGDREYYLSEGMDNYISKPVDMDALYNILVLYSEKTDKYIPTTIPKTISPNVNSIQNNILGSLLKAKDTMQFSNAIMKRLFETFIIGSYSTSIDLIEALEKDDMETVKRHAHSIRGGALSLSLSDVAEVCRLIEYGDAMNQDIEYVSLAQDLKNKLNSIYEVKEDILQAL